jgi:hypothetical protein
MSTASKLALAFAAVAFAGASVAQAQVSGSIAANATVQTPLTVSGNVPLEFGNVFPGVPRRRCGHRWRLGRTLDVAGQAAPR